jgi:ribosomal protein S4E
MGIYGKIVEIEKAKAKKRRNAFVTIEDAKGNQYQTVFEFVFAMGETKPLISLPEAV